MSVTLRGLVLAGVLAAGLALGRSTAPSGDGAARVSDAPSTAARPAPRRWEATVYLPLADNLGQSFAETVWQEALERLVTPFGGATLGPPQEGCWVDARQRVCREPVRPVVVSFAPERLGEFRRAVHAVGQHLGQEAMYVRFEEPRVELIPVGAAHTEGDR
jgi:hypothetical protein